MKSAKVIGIVIPVILLFFYFSDNIKAGAASNYIFKNYNIEMDVGEDNVLHITETLDCHFTVDSHGIYRKIPQFNKVKRQDGSITRNRAYISNVTCNEEYTDSTENGYYVMKIGDPNAYAAKDTQYIISYDYDLGKDSNKNFDELYYNLVGTEWESTSKRVTFEINMPKKFDASKLGFSYGYEGDRYTKGVTYSVNGNTIKGFLSKPLKAGEGLTVRCELPEGYFSLAQDHVDYISIVCFVINCAIFGIFILIFLKNKKSREKYAPTVEFYPPDDLICTDLACCLNEEVTEQQMVAVIFQLANKGYISIQEGYNTSVFGNNKKQSYSYVKLKEYDGKNKVEKLVFQGLFSSGSFVMAKDLSLDFHNKIKKAIKEEYKSVLRTNPLFKGFYDKVFKSRLISCKTISTIITIATIFFGLVIPLCSLDGNFNIDPIINFFIRFGGMFTVLFILYSSFFAAIFKTKGKSSKILRTAITIILYIAALLLFSGEEYMFTQKLVLKSTLAFFGAEYLLTCFMQNPRTDYGNQLYARTVGFKNFLQVAEKPKLETLVEQNPSYFYDILPYAFTLGVSDVWIKKFVDMAMQQPKWYTGSDYFDIYCMTHIYKLTYSSLVSNVTPSGGGVGSGGGSGGGSSGGGSGGGGGGSW